MYDDGSTMANSYSEFLYVYAIYIQKPNSISDMNVTTWTLDCIVLCQSFPLFNKYGRTQISSSLPPRAYFLFWITVIHSDVSSHTSPSSLVVFWNTGPTDRNRINILQTFCWKLMSSWTNKKGPLQL